VLYVEELIGPETVNTLPEKTLRAFARHGKVRQTLDVGVDAAERLLDQLAQAGIDYDDVTATLEKKGVQAFAASFDALLEGIEAFGERDAGEAAANRALRRGVPS
jgi:transaldolase